MALTGACASHSDRTKEARSALDAGRPKEALELYNEELDVDSGKDLPDEVGGDNALLILDRAMVLQQLDDFEHASRDLRIADKQIETLDFSRNALDDIGKYIFSDDTGPYKAPAYEKLMINTMNMVNYLAAGDLNGARVEARRLAVMQKYFRDHEAPGASMMAPGSYLAGFVFEKSGRADEALRYYDEALAYGDYRTLHEPIRRLAALGGYRSPRINKILQGSAPPASTAPSVGTAPSPGEAAPAEAEPADAAPGAPPPASDDSGELLVIVNFGRVPAKIAKRIPIGLALTYASLYLTAGTSATANRLAAQGLVTWVNYPELGKARGAYDRPTFFLDNRAQFLEGILAVDQESKKAYDEIKGAIIASAITRMISRVVAGEAARQAASDSTVGLLLSLGTQAALTVADTPDTRSWSTLPARVAFGRVRLAPGKHRVQLRARGVIKDQVVTLHPNGWSAVSLTALE